jgi:hypothetical protein
MPRKDVVGVGRIERTRVVVYADGREETYPSQRLALLALADAARAEIARAAARKAARALGSRGGRARGPSKARASAGDVSRAYWASLTPEQRREQGRLRAESRRRRKAEREEQ